MGFRARLSESWRAFAQAFRSRELRRLQLAGAGSTLAVWAYSIAIAVYEPATLALAGGPAAVAEYRAGFYRYCAAHKLTWLALAARIGVAPSRPLWPQG